MARDRTSFRQRDLTAALKAAKAAGLISPIARIDVGKDGIRIIPGPPEIEETGDEEHARRVTDVIRKIAEAGTGRRRKA